MQNWEKIVRLTPRALISAVAMAALLASNAQAAMLANINGAVTVNQGNGFVPASIGSSLAPGDRVRTGEGTANIVYENGCSAGIGPHQVVAVLAVPPPCNGVMLRDGPAMAPAEFPWAPVLLGGAAVGGAVALAVMLTNNSSNSISVSP